MLMFQWVRAWAHFVRALDDSFPDRARPHAAPSVRPFEPHMAEIVRVHGRLPARDGNEGEEGFLGRAGRRPFLGALGERHAALFQALAVVEERNVAHATRLAAQNFALSPALTTCAE